jgi:hypothetical protein
VIAFDYGIEELAATLTLGGVVVNMVVEGRAAGRGRTNRAAHADEHRAELSASARRGPRRRPGADATIEPPYDGDSDGDGGSGSDGGGSGSASIVVCGLSVLTLDSVFHTVETNNHI